MPPEEDQAMATGNMHKNWWSSAARVLSYVSGQTDAKTTDKQTYSSQYFVTILGKSN